jgi:energy-coupling factor transporter ATP-binding protein EcfA2
LRHERSRALDPHIHRHLWLGIKVLGEDGKWSNVDSRVAMRLQTVVNAWGDLASLTDPSWIAELTRHGFTLDADGEIAELAHLVRPLSRRSNQIEANRARLLAQWRQHHSDQHPDARTFARIDRLAWAQHRPAKAEPIAIKDWTDAVRAEIEAVGTISEVTPRTVIRKVVGELDRDLLAATAVVDADGRAAGSGGRFSQLDVEAGAIRAVSRSGVVAEAPVLQELIDDVAARALRLAIDVLPRAHAPAHVKGLVSRTSVQAKRNLAESSTHLGIPGADLSPSSVAMIAARPEPGTQLEPAQVQAACAIAGTSRLVTVIGPAGSGKTTLLRLARRALEPQQRRMLVVAPTRKAALVAGTAIGTPACSLHALLHDHGYRWRTDATGRQVWIRMRVGDSEPDTGALYRGPRLQLKPGDRIVVDEAGMLDLNAANALAQLALDTGAGLAMIGDPLQAAPVGHSGAMAIMRRHSASVVELTALHRFEDSEYGELTLRLREPADRKAAMTVAAALHATGRVRTAGSEADARERLIQEWLHHTGRGRRVALVAGSNAEAQRLNDRIQQELLDRRQLSDRQIAFGQDQQRLLIGDLIQTRRNDKLLDVANRAVWTITAIDGRGVRLASVDDLGHVRAISHEYANEHAHLAYASTVHGVQGETVEVSLVGPGVDAAGLYVGMTRGRTMNTAVVVARDTQEAIRQLADTMTRGLPELTIRDSRDAAAVDLGRAARHPVRLMRTGWPEDSYTPPLHRPGGAGHSLV